MPWLLRLFNLLAAPLVRVGAAIYARRNPEKYGEAGWRERFGDVPPRPNAEARPCIWIHAVSVGEVNATRTLVTGLESALPGHDVVLSTTTRTGQETARRNYPQHFVFYFPLDFPATVRRVLDRIRPAAILLMELEVWPNLIAECGRRGVPVAVVNGRVTEERSMRRFAKPLVRGIARWMFGELAFVAAQDATYAARFRTLGTSGQRVHEAGSLKYDTAVVAESIPGDRELADAMGLRRDAPILVAGSTGPGEERILLRAMDSLRGRYPSLQLVLVPRKPERFDEVAAEIEALGAACVRRSRQSDGAVTPAELSNGRQRVFLGDTMGELRKFYALADIVFIGRTLIPQGGSDLMEVAALAKPIIVGPHTDNFADVTEKLLAAGAAVRIVDGPALAAQVAAWLGDASAALAAGQKGRQVILANQGATRRIVELVRTMLNR